MMETERNKSSVIGKLMGLEAVPSPVYRQQKIFSEKYLQKSASIGSCEGRLSKIRRPKINNSSRNDYSFDGMENLKPNGKRVDYAETAVLRPNLGSVKHGSIPSFLLDSRAVFGWEYKKQLLERSKRSKVCEDIWSSKRVCNVGETPSMEDLELKQRLELGTRVVYGSNEGWKDKSVTKLPILKCFNFSSGFDIKCKNTSKGEFRSVTGRGINVSTNSENVNFSCSSNTSFERDSTCEDGFTPLNLMDVDDELLRNAGEGFQPSPNSVLEPDNFSSSEYGDISTDLHGLWMKLQVLVSESEENESKPEVVTLSDGDSTERTFCVGQNMKHSISLGPKQSQQFSYLVNVLNELRFHGGKMEISFERLHSPGHIINPLVFETLEKKYRKQNSWNRADRQLLFDRINLGLSEIVGSKPLSRKMGNFLRRDIIEEELWNILLGQEKEVNYDLSKKAVGKEPWLELADEVDTIVGEIEEYLFNELATELVAS